MEKPNAVIFDMDGTLVNVSSIRHYVRDSPKDFDAFHRESGACPPFRWVVDSAHMWKALGYRVIQVTARSAKYYPVTAWWLAENNVPSDAVYMREDGDFRHDYEVKKDILHHHLHKYNIHLAYDDNPSIVRLWEEYNIKVIQVPGWES